MTASVHGAGPRKQTGGRDHEGYREYTVVHIVKSTDIQDGPQVIMNASGLPTVGSYWQFGNDTDAWAFCTPYMKISPHMEKEGDATYFWAVEQKFTNKPMNRCNTTTIEDPTAEPQKVSGSFVRYTKEAVLDRYGTPVRSSSHEAFHGQQVEFDANRPTVHIEQNVASLGLSTFAPMIDTLNDATLWGLSARKIKLSNASWERHLYGVCSYYYTRIFDFDVSFEGFDRDIVDEGNKVLHGEWDKATGEWVLKNINGSAPDKNNPNHFMKAVDRFDNPIRVPLNGEGVPISPSGTGTGTSGGLHTLHLEYYPESNFLTLNIPTSF